MSDDRKFDEEGNRILENFTSFFGMLSQEFEVKDSYEIYMDKAKATDDFQEAINYMNKALSEAKKMISPELFEKRKGRLWLEPNGRPYLIVKDELADLYVSVGLFNEAIDEYYEVLFLNLKDNQGIKYKLINLLIIKKRYDEFEKLIDRFSYDESTFMLYPRALYYFSQDDDVNGKRYIKKALETNMYVAEYLLGLKKAELPIVNRYMSGGDDEATVCFSYGEVAWINVEKALYWMVDEYFAYVKKNDIDVEFNKEEAIISVKKICEDL